MNSRRLTRPTYMYVSPQRRRRRLAGLACMLLSLLAALKAQAAEPMLELGHAGAWQPTLALENSVDMQVHGLIAEVTVRQGFVNDSTEWLEGRYLLPLPERAAVGRLRIRIGERLIEGEVQEKQAARASYAEAAANGQRAALVEQDQPNLFSTALSNIGPGESIEIEIAYWQQVDYRDGEFSLSLPLTFTPPYVSGLPEPLPPADGAVAATAAVAGSQSGPPGLEPSVALRIALQAGLPLSKVYSPTHAISVTTQGQLQTIELADLVEFADRDFELRWRPLPSVEPQRAVFAEEVDGEHYAMVLMVPPTQPVTALPRELILVIDTSGSMHGAALDQAKAALESALLRLRPEDSFNIVRFSDRSEQLYPESVPASVALIADARHYVDALQANGGTEMGPALTLALAGSALVGHVRQVVLATDAAIGNEQALLAQIEHQRGDARVFPIGIGSAPNGHFIRKAGELGRGSSVLIRDIGEVSERMDGLFARLDRPVLRDLELHWPQASEVYPERLPDLYAGEPLMIVARLPSMQGELSIQGASRHAHWRSKLLLEPLQQQSASGVGKLWARARIEALEDALRNGAAESDIRPQMLETALRHRLASRYTSLVAVEHSPIRPTDANLGASLIPNAAPADDHLVMAQTATPARSELGMAIALALMIAALLRGRESATATAA